MSQTTSGDLFGRICPLVRQLADARPDTELLRCFVEGRQETAFAALLQRHGPMVLGVCRRLLGHQQDAEDAFQATFLTLARKASTLRNREVIGAWLHRVALRIAGRHRKDRERRATAGLPLAAAEQVDPLAAVSGRELLGLLDEELARLPETYRTPLILCYLEGRTQEEAACRLGCPRGTLKGRLERGRRLLHRRLTRRGVTLPAALLLTALAPPAPAVPVVLASASLRSALATVKEQAPAGTFAVPGRAKTALALLLGLGVLAAGLNGGGGAPKKKQPPQAETVLRKPRAQRPPRLDRYGDPLPPGALARLGTVRFRHEGQVQALTFSPDGRMLAGMDDWKVILWDARTGRELRRILGRGGAGALPGLTFTPDGKALVLLDDRPKNGSDLCFWDVSSGKIVRTLPIPSQRLLVGPTFLCFSPDGKRLALLGYSGKVALLDAASGKLVLWLSGHKASGYGLAFSPDGKTIALGTLKPSVQLWDATSGKLVRGIDSHGDTFVHAVAFSPDGKTLASGSGERIILSDVGTGKELSRLEARMDIVLSLAFTPDGKTLLSGSQDGKVRVWNLASRKVRFALDGRLGVGRSMALSADGKTVALGAACNAVRLWDVSSGKELFTEFHGHDAEVNDVVFSPDGKTLVSGGPNKQTRLWETATWRETRLLKGSAYALAVTADGRRLAAVASNKTVRVWDLPAGKEATTLSIPDADQISAVAFVSEGRQLVTLDHQWGRSQKTGGSRLALWDAATGRLLRRFALPSAMVCRPALTPDGRAAIVGERGKARLIDLESGQELLVLPTDKMDVMSLAVAPDGGTVLAGRFDGHLALWELATGKVVFRLSRHKRTVAAVAFAPGGRLLASAEGRPNTEYTYSAKGPITIHLWDAATGEEVERFQGLTANVTSLAFSPDGRRLVSGHMDSTVLVWNVGPAARKLATSRGKPTPAELAGLWEDLAAEPDKGQRALWRLASFPGSAAFLKERLRPAQAPSPARIRQLLADLSSDRFSMRNKAVRGLEELGEQAVPALRRLLESGPTLELRHRAEALLASPGVVRSPQTLRVLRAIRALEQMNSRDARDLLALLSKGAAAARTTREAKAALERSRRQGPSANRPLK